MEPKVIRNTLLAMQACVPADWTDEQATGFANTANPPGTSGSWVIRTGERLHCGEQARVPCDKRAGCVHIVFDC